MFFISPQKDHGCAAKNRKKAFLLFFFHSWRRLFPDDNNHHPVKYLTVVPEDKYLSLETRGLLKRIARICKQVGPPPNLAAVPSIRRFQEKLQKA